MLLQLKPYRLNIVFKKGKTLYLADTMSRTYLPDNDNSEHRIWCTRRSANNRPEVSRATANLSKINELILTGWPKKIAGVAEDIKPYFAFRDELAVENGVVYRGERAIVPQSLKDDYIQQLHQDILASKQPSDMPMTIFWPGMKSDIDKALALCSICQTSRNHQPREPLLSYSVPSQPWSIVATDIFYRRSITYLVTVDTHTKWYRAYADRQRLLWHHPHCRRNSQPPIVCRAAEQQNLQT